MPKSRSRNPGSNHLEQRADELTDDQIIALVELHGVAYFHSSGCVVLKNGTWLQPEQWKVQLQQMIDDCEREGEIDGR